MQRQVHCNFTPSELVAGVQAIQQRVDTGRWGSLADPAALQARANAINAENGGTLGTPAFIAYQPGTLTGDNGPLIPFTGGSWPRWPRW